MSDERCYWPANDCQAAEAIREATIDDCIEACRREYLDDPVKNTGDEDYDNAIKHCIDALHALKRCRPQNSRANETQSQEPK